MNAQPLISSDPGIATTRDSDTIIVDDATLTSARIYARHLFPAHGAHVYLLLELIALFPAEVRTICRIVRRSRRQRRQQQMEGQGQGRRLLGAGSTRGMGGRRQIVSLHEVALFVIKYIALICVVCQTIGALSRHFLTTRSCGAVLWISNVTLFLDTTLVTASFAWRAYLVCGKTTKAGLLLLGGCLLHLAAALAEATGLRGADIVGGFCREAFAQPESVEALSFDTWWSRRSLWYTLYSVFFDTAICATTCRKLLQTRPSRDVGWLPTCKLLFDSATYYLASMTCINVAQLAFMLARPHVAPSSVVLAASVQVVLGLQYIVKILDRVHGGDSGTQLAGMPEEGGAGEAKTMRRVASTAISGGEGAGMGDRDRDRDGEATLRGGRAGLRGGGKEEDKAAEGDLGGAQGRLRLEEDMGAVTPV